jgi:predicted dehydrogenase
MSSKEREDLVINKKEIGIGLVGYSMMGKAHSNAYRAASFYFDLDTKPILNTIVGRDLQKVEKAANTMGWQNYSTDWEELLTNPNIDLIDISSPNNTHKEIAIAAAEAGKHIFCEKPLSLTLKESKEMLEAVNKHNVLHMVCHNYRFAPAVQYAKQLISEGRLGKIYHVRATFLQDWLMDPEAPLTWRLQKDVSGSGTLGDLGIHIIDLARYLIGEFSEVTGMMDTFIKKRPLGTMTDTLQLESKSDEYGEVTVDDAAAFLARFENGTMGTFEVSRYAAGNRAGNRFEINGEFGSVRWDMENMNNLEVYLAEDEEGLQGFRTINCTEHVHPFAGDYWPAGHILGYEHTFVNIIKTLLDGISNGISPQPNFKDGVMNQAIVEAVERSSETKSWVSIDNILQESNIRKEELIEK